MVLTQLEIEALKSITHSDFYENGRESVVWDFSVFDVCSIPTRSRSGVFSSLVQKGLISITEKEKPYTINKKGERVKNPFYSRDCNFGTISITQSGYDLLDSLGLINETGFFIK